MSTNNYAITKKVTSAYRTSVVVSSILGELTEMPDKKLDEFARAGTVEIAIDNPALLRTLGKFTGEDYLKVEDMLIEYGEAFGFDIKFVISNPGVGSRLTDLAPDDDNRPEGDDDSDPRVDLPDTKEHLEYPAMPLTMHAAAGGRQ